jgi:YVTN family beta-propeller protein
VVVAPDGKRVYVACGGTSRVAVIDAATNRVVGSIRVGRRPWGIAMSRDGTRMFTANGLTNDVSVIDPASNRVVGTVKVGRRPWGVAVVERRR